MKSWLVFDIADEPNLDAINNSINNELINANLRTYPGSPVSFTEKRYHSNGLLVSAPFNIDKVPEWKPHILLHINEEDLVDLSDDWDDNP